MIQLIHTHAGWRGIPLRIAGNERGLRVLLLGSEKETLAELKIRFPGVRLEAGHLPVFDLALAHLENPANSPPPLAPEGTDFQQLVWMALRRIPVGKTTHYAALAASIGRPKAARAVAAACAANPIALLIPCHRVIRRDGTLSGYRWGVKMKATLLASER